MAGSPITVPRPLVGISAGTPGETRDHRLERNYSSYFHAVVAAGGEPRLIHAAGAPEGAARILSEIDGLLLTGGEDVHPARYGKPMLNDKVRASGERDSLEIELVKQSVKAGIPVFGICRGLQVINVALGGTLVQDIPSQRPSEVAHSQNEARSACTHRVEIKQGTKLAKVLQSDALETNSFHHQAIEKLAPRMRPAAWAPDGIVEAAESPEAHYVLGVQWHPEDLTQIPAHLRLFEALVAAARSGNRASRGRRI